MPDPLNRRLVRPPVPSALLSRAAAGAILAGGLALAGGAGAQDRATEIAEACGVATNLPAEICGCVSDRAMDELSDMGQAYLTAMLEGDQMGAAAMGSELSAGDRVAAATLMTDAPADCARGE